MLFFINKFSKFFIKSAAVIGLLASVPNNSFSDPFRVTATGNCCSSNLQDNKNQEYSQKFSSCYSDTNGDSRQTSSFLQENSDADIKMLNIESGIRNIINSTYKNDAIDQYVKSFNKNIKEFSSIGKIKAYAALYNNVFLNANKLCNNRNQNIHVLDSFAKDTLSTFIQLLNQELNLAGTEYIDDYLQDVMQNSSRALQLAVCRLQQIFNKKDDPVKGRIDNLKQLSNIAAMLGKIDETTKVIFDMSMEDNITTKGGCIPGYINRMIQLICNYINNNDLRTLREHVKVQKLPKTYLNIDSGKAVLRPIDMVIGRLNLAENKNDNIWAVFNGATDEGDLEKVCIDLSLGDISTLTVQEALNLITAKKEAEQSVYREKENSNTNQVFQDYTGALKSLRRALGIDAMPYNDTELKDMCEVCFYNIKELGFESLVAAKDLLNDIGGDIIMIINNLHTPYKKLAFNHLSKTYDAFLNAQKALHLKQNDLIRMNRICNKQVMAICKQLRINDIDCKQCFASLMELDMSIEDGILLSRDTYVVFPGVEFLRKLDRTKGSTRQEVINGVKEIYDLYRKITR